MPKLEPTCLLLKDMQTVAAAASLQSHLHPHSRLPVRLDVLSSPSKDTSHWTEGPLELQDDLTGDLKLITPTKTLLLRKVTLTGTGDQDPDLSFGCYIPTCCSLHLERLAAKKGYRPVDSPPSLDAHPFGETLSMGFS